MKDYADKKWLKKLTRPTWLCMIKVSGQRALRAWRRQSGFDPIPHGIRFRIEGEFLYVEPLPNPAPVREQRAQAAALALGSWI